MKRVNKMSKMNLELDYEAIDNEIKMEKKSRKKPLVVIVVALTLLVGLLVVYVGGAIYFSGRFFFNTQVSGVDFSRQTASAARDYVENKADDFYISIIAFDHSVENIYADEIDLTFIASDVIENLLDEQNAFAWPLSLMRSQEIDVPFEIEFDEALLDARILTLDVVTNGQTLPISATVVIENHEAVIVAHQEGNVVDVKQLQTLLQTYVERLAPEFSTARDDLFMQPELTAQSAVIIDAFEAASHYLATAITYSVGEEIVLDRQTISDWVTINEDLEVSLDESQVQAWLNEFIATVNTHGTTRELTTPTGREVSVTGGYYGWIVSRDLEFAELLSNIRNGEVIYREPIYFQRAESHGPQDWGNTFLQVDLTEQHMWAFVNGEMVFEAPVITGLPQGDRATPQGVYFILQMETPSVLIGATDPDTGQPIYETRVQYWMRTTWAGHGFHDATWQEEAGNAFGGTTYRTHGSHGCTNLTLADASILYNLIYLMMPVVVHY